MAASDLLLALVAKLEVDRQPAAYAEDGLDRLQVGEHLALVVAGAARVDPAVADRRLERRTVPGVQRLRRLDVVVAVDEHRPCRVGRSYFSEDDRISARLHEPRLGAGVGHEPLHEGGALADSRVLRRDRRLTQQRAQLVDEALTVRLDVIEDVVHNLRARKAKGSERITEPGAT